ncbi:hypothetical protein KUV64_27290 [Mameliella alba]|uniref:hypothetical protein n=1 Tax=Mameliella alba TaxID=561184 RepID=UPI001C97F14A|nr:hypothetical protein [Mameliella alba]MBY6122827.1 hypothetical protein [Mameliella alba]
MLRRSPQDLPSAAFANLMGILDGAHDSGKVSIDLHFEVQTMLANLLDFYEGYPDVLLELKGIDRLSLKPDLIEALNFHGRRQREILDVAQFYQIDERAQMMLHDLSAQMQKDGLDSMFSNVRLPFPALLLTVPEPKVGEWPAALITQDDDALYTQIYLANRHGLFPNLLIFRSQGSSVDILHSPTFALSQVIGENVTEEAAIKQEKSLCSGFLAMAVGMSILFEHKAMLEKEEVPTYPRAERRRAQKSGRTLPNKSIIKVTLGELGRHQLEATSDKRQASEGGTPRRRAHWVQGHFMRNRSGGISWRNPHIRGVGPLLEQERHISSDED